MTLPLISAPRRKEKGFDWSFNKALFIAFDGPFQSLNPILEHVMELLESDTIQKVCQCLDHRIRISKTSISQCCLGSSKKSEVSRAYIR
jgi:hypothetical protein